MSLGLNTLPEKERLAIHLYYLDPNPVAASRAMLGLSRGGYYKTLARARQQLAAFMQQDQLT